MGETRCKTRCDVLDLPGRADDDNENQPYGAPERRARVLARVRVVVTGLSYGSEGFVRAKPAPPWSRSTTLPVLGPQVRDQRVRPSFGFRRRRNSSDVPLLFRPANPRFAQLGSETRRIHRYLMDWVYARGLDVPVLCGPQRDHAVEPDFVTSLAEQPILIDLS